MCFVVIMRTFFFPLVLFQFLRGGGEKLVDELSLARQGRVGDNIVTRGHDLNTKCECIDCYACHESLAYGSLSYSCMYNPKLNRSHPTVCLSPLVINPRRMREGYGSRFVRLSVC